MRTYVTSTHASAKVAHIGNAYYTACRYVFTGPFVVTSTPPEGMRECSRCLDALGLALEEAASLGAAMDEVQKQETLNAARDTWERHVREHDLALRFDSRDRQITLLLVRGFENVEIARELGWSLRSTVRHLTSARERAGARTRFQWGYLLGFEAARTRDRAE